MKRELYSSQLFKLPVLTCALALGLWAWPVLGQDHDHEDNDHEEHDKSEHHDSLVTHDDHDDHAGHQENGHASHDEHQDIVRLTQAEMDEFGVRLSTAGPGTLRLEIVAPGEVAVNYDKLAHITPRFPGVVIKVNKHLGDKVRTGEVLAIVESNEGMVPYEIKSLLSGTVIEKHITIGEVGVEEKPAFVIADLDTVWVNLSIYQMHLPYVRVGQQVTISSGQEFADVSGVISYLSPIVDKHTRTATARVVLANHDGNLRPGLFVNGTIVANEEPVPILVPKSSLQKFEGADVIFISSPEGFKPTPVKIGRSNRLSAEILSGLTPGQRYVSQGAFTLKAELQKSSLSSGHNH